jgi:hypothetical protein
MRVNSFNISIIDTVENTTSLTVESVAVDAPKLIYLGDDNKYNHLLTSELQFNFWVSENIDAKYFHLFTGSEKRFKVVLEDTSVLNFPKTIWSGYLLPEQFEEPYKHSGFFVNFTATDGIALLKSAEYFINPLKEKQSIMQVIANCLVQTGLELDIYFSPAIVNVGFNLDYLDLLVNTLSYEDDKKSYYDVLVLCLQSIGCTLFLQDNVWYIIGLARFKDSSWVCRRYVYDDYLVLNFDSEVVVDRAVVDVVFEANPIISVAPPVKKVTTVWDAEKTKTLIPEGVVTHLPAGIDVDIDDRTVLYWGLETNKSILLNTWLLLLNFDTLSIDFNSYYNGFKFYKKPVLEDNASGPFVSINNLGAAISVSDLATNFIYLQDPFFIYGSEDLERFGMLEIAFETVLNTANLSPVVTSTELKNYFDLEGVYTSVVNDGSGYARVISDLHGLETDDYISILFGDYKGVHKVTKVDVNTFDIEVLFTATSAGKWFLKPFYNVFHFAITRKSHEIGQQIDEEIYLSSFDAPGMPDGILSFDLSIKNNAISGEVNLEKIAFTEDGYYNIRLYPIVSHRMLPGNNIIMYTTVNASLEVDDDRELVKTRSINFSTERSLDLFHSSSRDLRSDRSFLFSESLTASIAAGSTVAGQFLVSPISSVFKDVYSNNVLWYTTIKLELSESDVVKINAGYKLYVLKTGSTELIEVISDSYSITGNVINQVKFAGNAGVFIEETDVVYLQLTSSSEDLAYSGYWLDKWQRYDVAENISFDACINEIYHGLSDSYNFKISGVMIGLLAPTDIVAFSYKNSDKYYPTTIEIDLAKGKTTATIIETKNEKVIDYAE